MFVLSAKAEFIDMAFNAISFLAILTNSGRFDHVTSLFQTMAGCPTTAEHYTTSQVEITSTISADYYCRFI